MTTIVQVSVSNQLECLKPILTTWVERLEQLSTSLPQTKDQYYLESTLVSLLAGSAWANGVQAVTELKIKRSSQTGNDSWGRLDLLLHFPDRKIAIDAKLEWDSAFIHENISHRLETACSEAKSIIENRADVLVGLVFYVPWWNNTPQRQELESKVLDSYSSFDADAKACYYNRDLDYPGVIALCRVAAR